MEMGFNVEAVPFLGRDDAIVLFLAELHDEFDAILKAQEEEDGFFASDTRHIHVVYLSGSI